MEYPEHKIPEKSYDHLINRIILVVAVTGGALYWLLQ